MTMVVVDASALLGLLRADQSDAALRRRLMVADMAAPEFVDLEVLSALRRDLRRGLITAEQADDLAATQANAPVTRFQHRALLSRVWELRGSVTTYDAAYLALAEQLDAPLITADSKLAGSNGHRVKIEVFPAS